MTWVNFRELREKLDFREVLTHYGVKINAKNHVQHHGPCPLPAHEGPRRSSSFSANFDKRIWRCFGCNRQGNLIDWVCHMENLDPSNPGDVRKAALILANRYSITSDRPTPKAKPKENRPETAASRAIVNAPLDFTLKGLDPEHPYLNAKGFANETIGQFELGYASRGLMQGRIAIPLRNLEGQLIGYAGKIVDESLITEENPEYRFPSERIHDGKRYCFSKSLFLYNAHAVSTPANDLILVTNFPSVWWLWQHGYRHSAGLMGSSCSREQSAIIVGLVPRRGRVWVFTDGTKVGRYCAEETLRLLTPYRFCRWIELQDERKPTDCDGDELRRLLE